MFIYLSLFRYRANKKTLKIKSSEKGDTGVYHCKAINGFGKVEIRIDLIVIGGLKEIIIDQQGYPLMCTEWLI